MLNIASAYKSGEEDFIKIAESYFSNKSLCPSRSEAIIVFPKNELQPYYWSQLGSLLSLNNCFSNK